MIAPPEPRRLAGALNVPPAIILLAAIDLAFGVVYLTDQFLGGPFGYEISRLFDLALERNIPVWYSSTKLFVVGALLFVVGWVARARGVPRAWILMVMAACVLAFSIDEYVGIHERLGKATDRLVFDGLRSETVLPRSGTWVFFLGVPALLVLLWMVYAVRGLLADARITWIFVAGILVFIGSAAGLELLSNFVSGRALWLQVAAEECGEMLGATILLWGAYELLGSHRITLFAEQGSGATGDRAGPVTRDAPRLPLTSGRGGRW